MDLSHIRSGKRKKFLNEYIDTGDAVRAARFAGYDKGDEQKLRLHASNLKSQMRKEIDALTKEKMQGVGPRALTVMEQLMNRSESDTVRFQAAKDLLDRAGWRAVEREQEIKRTVEEMEAQLIALVGEDGAQLLLAKVVTRRSIPVGTIEDTSGTLETVN